MSSSDPRRFVPSAAGQRNSIFAHHGSWATGVRLVGQPQFAMGSREQSQARGLAGEVARVRMPA